MTSFYYTREPGADGQILTADGTAPGKTLDKLLSRERPPLRAALEIGSALADVLCIALEDGMVHGDIDPTFVKIDERGSVHLEGFGIAHSTMAPEGTSDQPPVDMYGLGRVLHAMLTQGGLGRMPSDPDGHDDHVVNRVLEMDFGQVKGKRWVDDVRRFLCTILAWRPDERPVPLDAANVLASVAGSCPGEGVEAWAKRVHAMSTSRSVLPPTGLPEPEALGGPVQLGAPLRTGPVRKAPSSKGESTMAWSRDKIAAMLAEQDAEDELPPPRVANSRASVPPQNRYSEPARSPERYSEPARPPERYSEPPRMEPARPPIEASRPERRSEARSDYRPESQPARPSIGAGAREEDPFADPEPSSGSGMKIGIAVGVVLFLLCGGFLALGGGWVAISNWNSGTTDVTEGGPGTSPTPETPPFTTPAENPATTPAEPGTPPTPAVTTNPPVTTTSPVTTNPPVTTTKPPSTTTKPPATTTTKPPATTTTKPPATTTTKPPATTTAPVESSGPFQVKFSSQSKAKVICGDGQSAEFVGGTTMSFELRTSCRVKIGSGMAAFPVSRTVAVTCTEAGGTVTCTGF